MKRWTKLMVALLALMALVTCATVGWFIWRDTMPEPLFRGKPLSHWLTGYQLDGEQDWDEADKAMKQIGTNAIPTLLRFLEVRDTKLKLNVLAAAKKYGLDKHEHISAEKLNFAGAMGFRKLGAGGASAVPELVTIYGRNISSWSRSATVMALDDLAPFSIPALDRELAARTPRERVMMVGVISRADADPAAVVPILTKCLHDTDAAVRTTAATSLGSFGTNALSAVPDLLKLRQDPDAETSHAAAYALGRLNPTSSR